MNLPNPKCTVWTRKHTVHALANLFESQYLWDVSVAGECIYTLIDLYLFIIIFKKAVLQLTLGTALIVLMGKLTKRKSLGVLAPVLHLGYFYKKPSTECENLKRAKSVSTLGSTSPRSSLLISPGTGACIIRFEIHQDSHVSWSPSTASTLPVFLIFLEPAGRNANAMLAKSFHIYEGHTCAPRYL